MPVTKISKTQSAHWATQHSPDPESLAFSVTPDAIATDVKRFGPILSNQEIQSPTRRELTKKVTNVWSHGPSCAHEPLGFSLSFQKMSGRALSECSGVGKLRRKLQRLRDPDLYGMRVTLRAVERSGEVAATADVAVTADVNVTVDVDVNDGLAVTAVVATTSVLASRRVGATWAVSRPAAAPECPRHRHC